MTYQYAKVEEEIVRSVGVNVTSELMKRLKEEGKTCFLARWIHEDLEKNGKLTGYPGQGDIGLKFGPDGKMKYMKRLGII